MSLFNCLPEYKDTIDHVYINITKSHLISKMKNQKLADVYKHEDVDACINNLKPFFSKQALEVIEEHILFNYEHMGIKIDRNKPGEQMSLF